MIHLLPQHRLHVAFEFLETSVTACSHTHNWFSFMAGGEVTNVALRAGVLLYVV